MRHTAALWSGACAICRPSRPVDDSVPCSIAADLIAAARREVPIIDLALNAVEQGFGMPTVETSIGPDGATTNLICFDDGGDYEALLLKRTGRQLDSADNKGRSRTASSSRPCPSTQVAAHVGRRQVRIRAELGDAEGSTTPTSAACCVRRQGWYSSSSRS